jgi:glycosyltransferase involved in cell wall biosynthesis
VITVVRNDVKRLATAIASVAAQNYPNLEYIIMDGGSTDGTVDIIRAHEKLITYWESKPDGGPSNAFNKGLAHATGEWVVLLSSDDVLPEGTLLAVGEAGRDNPDADIISGGAELIYPDGRKRVFNDPQQVDFSLKAALAGLTLFNSRYYKRHLFPMVSALREIDENLSKIFPGRRFFVAGDRELLIRLALLNAKGISVRKILYTYCAHADSITFGAGNHIAVQKENLWIAQEVRKDYPLDNVQKKLINQWEAQEIALLALYALKAKKPAEARDSWIYLLRHPVHFGVAILKLAARFITNRIKKIIKVS